MKEKLFSKRGILYLANGIFFVALVIFCTVYLTSIFSDEYLVVYDNVTKDIFIMQTVGKYLLIQCAFTLLSAIVYFLAIMARALNKKYKEQVNNDKK